MIPASLLSPEARVNRLFGGGPAIRLKALSFTQPWGSLLAIGAKTIETRSWYTPYRGLLAIHAAKGFPEDCRDLASCEPFRACLRQGGYVDQYGHFEVRALERGAIIAVGWLARCRPTDGSQEKISNQEYQFGDFSPGRWAWELQHVRILDTPIPARGSLGLWDWEGTLA